MADGDLPGSSGTFAAPAGLSLEDRPSLDCVVLSFPLRGEPDRMPELTTAESAVLESVRAGLSNAEIARQRGVSVRTVANQLSSLFKKLGVSSRLDAALLTRHRARTAGGVSGSSNTVP